MCRNASSGPLDLNSLKNIYLGWPLTCELSCVIISRVMDILVLVSILFFVPMSQTNARDASIIGPQTINKMTLMLVDLRFLEPECLHMHFLQKLQNNQMREQRTIYTSLTQRCWGLPFIGVLMSPSQSILNSSLQIKSKYIYDFGSLMHVAKTSRSYCEKNHNYIKSLVFLVESRNDSFSVTFRNNWEINKNINR